MLPIRGTALSGLKRTVELLKRVVWHGKSLIWPSLGFSAFLLLITALNVGVPLLFKQLIQLLSADKVTSWGTLLLMAYGLAWGVAQASSQLRSYFVTMFLEGSINRYCLAIFDHLHMLSYRFHLERQTGALTSTVERAHHGIEALVWGLFVFLIPTVGEILCAVAIISYLYGLLYGGAVAVVLLAYTLVSMIGLGVSKTVHEEYNKTRSTSKSFMIDSLLNYAAVKYFGTRNHESETYEGLLKKQERTAKKMYQQMFYTQLAQALTVGTGLGFMTWLSGTAVMKGTFTVGDFVLINSYIMLFINPLSYFGHVLQQVRKGLVDVEDSLALLSLEPEIASTTKAQEPMSNQPEVVFESVSFGYTDKRSILHDISFIIPPGKTTALVGQTGSGKSTIWKLLFRLYDCSSGKVLINGHDIKDVPQEALQKLIGIVPQAISLFNNTLYYNITYGNKEATKDQVYEALYVACLEEFVNKLPDGLDTQVGEHGLMLSGGEKQRLAIARAVIRKPSLYIFDEALSALDSHTEREIQQRISEVAQDATKLIIAHRLSTLVEADEILVLKDGVIIERGDHAYLYGQGGEYSMLWQKQMHEARK